MCSDWPGAPYQQISVGNSIATSIQRAAAANEIKLFLLLAAALRLASNHNADSIVIVLFFI